MSSRSRRACVASHIAWVAAVILCSCVAVVGTHRYGKLGWVGVPSPRLLANRSRPASSFATLYMCPAEVPPPGKDLQRPRGRPAAVPLPDASKPEQHPRISVRRAVDPPLSQRQMAAQKKEFTLRLDVPDTDVQNDTIGKKEKRVGTDFNSTRAQRGARGGRTFGERGRGGNLGTARTIRLQSLGRPADVKRHWMNLVDGQQKRAGSRGAGPMDPLESGPGGQAPRISGVSLVPKNLASFQSIEDLLPIFEAARKNGTDLVDVVEGPDAVAAMNHLKRLQRQTRGQPELSDRFERVLKELADVAEVGLPYMSAKNVALALNSVSHRQGFNAMFTAGVRRIRLLCTSNYKLHTQSLAMMVNALVKRRMLDASLVKDISITAQRIDPESYSPQSVAIILNAFSKVARHDSKLFLYMSEVAMRLDKRMWDAQACALLLNSYARSGERDANLFTHFEDIIVQQAINSVLCLYTDS